MADIPKELLYTEEHEYIKPTDAADVVAVGITHYAQDQLGDIVFIELPKVGTAFGKHDVFGTVEAVKAVSELYTPLAGEVVEVNDRLDKEPALVNTSPYGLTSAIHTASVHRAMRFAERVAAGVVVVNAGTHGSEPHMGFGGVRQSGTGWKEAGVEALDVYSETQYVNLVVDPRLA